MCCNNNFTRLSINQHVSFMYQRRKTLGEMSQTQNTKAIQKGLERESSSFNPGFLYTSLFHSLAMSTVNKKTGGNPLKYRKKVRVVDGNRLNRIYWFNLSENGFHLLLLVFLLDMVFVQCDTKRNCEHSPLF